jgi:GST-like protein
MQGTLAAMTEPIDLYYWPTPNGWKITIALEEMGLPYRVQLIDIGKGDQFDPDFLKIAPNNRMPAIVDPDGPGGAPVSIFESAAILMYLGRKTGRFYGTDERSRIAVEEWLMWQMGGVGPMAGQAHHFLKYAPGLDPPQVLPYAQDRYRREVDRLYSSSTNGSTAAISSPATTPSPTWRSGPGPRCGRARAKASTASRTLPPGSIGWPGARR